MRLILGLATFLAGLNAGLLMTGVLESIHMKTVGLGGYLQFHQPRDQLYRRVMPPLLLTLMALCIVCGLFGMSGSARLLSWVAFALVALDIMLTVRVMVPLNGWLQKFDALNPPPEAQQVRERWYALHPLRTVLGLGAFVALLVSGAP
ncbi:putative membrane protein [Deinococcus metalli]|uniref:Putative membrane protein n=1 Tax=Deinococcus metalli TaxID=1141878 RepID=A0A7W8KIM4_9DEIO|nr:DUF1772 domain-containing protein [Deinococcus metalli]MBB5377873.1 putative membrane protein [Deinococcus metalli]GHF55348.1 hypothetical protein GCM10017781_34610 [Deinococcus metalli]